MQICPIDFVFLENTDYYWVVAQNMHQMSMNSYLYKWLNTTIHAEEVYLLYRGILSHLHTASEREEAYMLIPLVWLACLPFEMLMCEKSYAGREPHSAEPDKSYLKVKTHKSYNFSMWSGFLSISIKPWSHQEIRLQAQSTREDVFQVPE